MWTFREADYNRNMGNYFWQESVYTSQILDFSQIVMDDGMVKALDAYG